MAFKDPDSFFKHGLESSTLHDLVDHSKHRTAAAFGFGTPAGYDYYSTQWVGEMAERAICMYQDAGLSYRTSSDIVSVVGLCAPTCIESVITFVALMRMGHTILILAPTLRASALEYLVAASGCRVIVNGVPSHGYKAVPLVTMAKLTAMKDTINGTIERPTDMVLTTEEEPILMVHSSGTTGQPKLILKTHAQLLATIRGIPPPLREQSLYMGATMYWVSSIHAMLFGFAKPRGPVLWPSEEDSWSAESIKNSLLEGKPQIAWCNPTLIQAASDTVEGIEALKHCDLVVNTGAVLASYCADRLIRAGVHLAVEFGMTEVPVSMSSARWAGDQESWDYMAPLPMAIGHVQFRPLTEDEGSTWAGGQQLFELVVLPSLPALDKQWANAPDGSVHTGDLFLKHKTEDRYKCVGRMRDEVDIVRGSDVQILKAPLYEQVIKDRHHDDIDAAVLFGDERPEPGVLIFPKQNCVIPDEDLVERIWGTVKHEINGTLSIGLAKNMIVVVRYDTVPRTPKGTIVRAEVLLNFKSRIEQAYGA